MEELSKELLDAVRQFMSTQIPFNAFLGLQVEVLERGRALLRLPFRPEFIGDPFRPALHGGVISTMIDTCGGAAVWTTIRQHDRVSTIDLRVDYLRPGRMLDVMVEAHVLRAGNRVGVTSMRAYHPDAPTQTIAEGKGVYNIKRGHAEAP